MTRQARSVAKLSCWSLANSLVLSAGSYTSSTDSDPAASAIDSVIDMRLRCPAGVFVPAVETCA